MIRRLVEQDYYSTPIPTPEQVNFWLAELRTPEILLDVVTSFPALASLSLRSVIQAALKQDRNAIEDALEAEQKSERAADRLYWDPLKKELEELRRLRNHPDSTTS
jgi:hypothetical protein